MTEKHPQYPININDLLVRVKVLSRITGSSIAWFSDQMFSDRRRLTNLQDGKCTITVANYNKGWRYLEDFAKKRGIDLLHEVKKTQQEQPNA